MNIMPAIATEKKMLLVSDTVVDPLIRILEASPDTPRIRGASAPYGQVHQVLMGHRASGMEEQTRFRAGLDHAGPEPSVLSARLPVPAGFPFEDISRGDGAVCGSGHPVRGQREFDAGHQLDHAGLSAMDTDPRLEAPGRDREPAGQSKPAAVREICGVPQHYSA